MIPQTDPKAGYLAHQSAIDAAVQRVLHSGWYILGKEVAAFEQAWAGYLGVKHAVGVASGTDAIELALRACGIGPGDLVFTVGHTAVATVVGVENAGATPVLVDIDPVTFNLDPNSLEEALRRLAGGGTGLPGRPRAILPVHLYGQPADMDSLGDLARRHGLLLLEDCAQAHGAAHRGRRVGSIGLAAAFSFYPTKNLGALGDGGAVVTSDDRVAEQLRALREYGWKERYISHLPGINSRLDELQAAVLQARLPGLEADNQARRRIAADYDRLLAGSGLGLPRVAPGGDHVYHQYVLRSPDRDGLRQRAREQGVGTLVHYPAPVHLQPAYRSRLCPVVPLPHTEKAAREVLSLPMFPELEAARVEQAAKVLGACAAALTR